MHLDLPAAAVERHLGDAGHQRAGIVEIGEAERTTVALAPPIRHLRHPLNHLGAAWRVLQELEAIGDRIDTALARDLVHKRLGGEPVGGEADPAQRIRAHTGITIELFDQLVRDLVAAQIAPSIAMPSLPPLIW